VKSQIVHWLIVILCASLGPGVAEWLRHCATSREVPGSIPGTICVGSTQLLNVSSMVFSWGKGGRCVRLSTYHPCTAERQDNLGPYSTRNSLGHLGLLRDDLYHCVLQHRDVAINSMSDQKLR